MEKKEKSYYCPHCGKKISFNKKDISSEEYFGACVDCDEDFFKFELIYK